CVGGTGQQESFPPYPQLKKIADFQNGSSASLAVDTQTGEVFSARTSLGISRVDVPTGTISAVATGSLFGGSQPIDFKVTYVDGARRFLAATVFGLFVDEPWAR